MTTKPTNAQRAQRLEDMLCQYDTDDTDIGSLIDLMVDARHWCDREEQCYGHLDRIAHDHYLAELCDEWRPA